MNLPFLAAWRSLAPEFAEPEAEWRFYRARLWRFDFAWPQAMVAVEFDGGQHAPGGGRHNTDEDRDKLNHAAALGWRVLRFSNQQWADDPSRCVDLIVQALCV